MEYLDNYILMGRMGLPMGRCAFSLTKTKGVVMSHLSIRERLKIEHYLRAGKSFQEIADLLSKARSTVVREVKKHRVESLKVGYHRIQNRCIHRRKCQLKHVCTKERCYRQCSTCSLCNEFCSGFQEEECQKLLAPPYVCNGCKEESRCTLKKQFYLHDSAEKTYRKVLIESRSGANITEEERLFLNEILHAGTRKGQSIHHILMADRDQITVGEKTVYRYINAGLLRTKRGDMLRSCMMKPRKRKAVEHKIDRKCRMGRTYDDFEAFQIADSDTPFVEMDSVLGRPGGKTLLTLQFNSCGMMWLFLRQRNTAQTVIDVFNKLESQIGFDTFCTLFPVILTDNGSEFSNPVALEISPFNSKQRTRIFYCDPYSAYQKGHVENNHLNLRRILEKKTSFDDLEQSDVTNVMSHLNSFARKSLNNVPAITLFETMYGKDILNKIGVSLIAPKDVILTSQLISKK